ncbi:VWA domain containing CoxE-like protein [Musa troglodytarum]|uniref:VWA domain containing CoxE-like protein n=1 Tax=Musa troglodytarum TaxID=320322 RepID=A0A9E7JI30_9LILI|nr:VWA domain containing CoxE-like protein [Musa troglodytarum]
MSDSGRQQALQAVNSLVSSGGTNIAEGLRKGFKVIDERRERNPVCSILLLSDGQDTYTFSSSGGAQPSQPDYKALVPSSVLSSAAVSVHSFGFGADHDSAAMHAIAEISGGTFSFIESEGVLQDAFAQCIGGILSVVVQEMRLGVECVHPGVRLAPINSGSYRNQLLNDARTGFIYVGDLYADEERDFLVSVNVPFATEETALLKVACVYKDPVSKEAVRLPIKEVRIQRPQVVSSQTPSIEVDRERNRVRAAEAMSDARAAAERGFLSDAVSILEERRRTLSESLAARASDRLCLALDAELREMQERMASRRRYEDSGRAYVLSGLSSHSWQRATARGDSTDGSSRLHSYQTPSMVEMLHRSQTVRHSTRLTRSLATRPRPI